MSENELNAAKSLKQVAYETLKQKIVSCEILPGSTLTEDMLVAKRAGEGISAKYWDMVVGTYAIKDFEIDEPIVLW